MENENKNPNIGGNGGNNPYVDFDKFIAQVKVALINSADPEIAPLLEARDYKAADINAAMNDLDELDELYRKQKKEYGEQYDATKNYRDAENTLHEEYIDHVALARIAFKNNPAALTALGLTEERKRTQSGYAAQAKLFYDNCLLNADYKAAMIKKGVSEADMQAQLAIIENFSTLKAAQKKETSEAQAATKLRDDKYELMEKWYAILKRLEPLP